MRENNASSERENNMPNEGEDNVRNEGEDSVRNEREDNVPDKREDNVPNEEQIADCRPRRVSHPVLQLILTWLLLLLTALVFIFTVYYAFDTTILIRSSLVSLSPTNTILVIRVLSGVTGFLMIALVTSASERINWMLVARVNGLRMSDFLSLSATTDQLGLLAIVFSRARDLSSSRGWASFRYDFTRARGAQLTYRP